MVVRNNNKKGHLIIIFKLCMAYNTEAIKDFPLKCTELLHGPGVYNRLKY